MPRLPNIYPIILAAGASSRLGFPKALARFGERIALQIAVENCTGLQAPIVVLGAQAARVRPAAPEGPKVVINRDWRRGQFSSLLAGLKHVPARADFMLYPVDYPLLTPQIISKLVAGFLHRDKHQLIAVPSFRRRGGHPVIFSSRLRGELERAETAREVVYRDRARVKFVLVRSEAIWKDIDTPGAYRRRLQEYRKMTRG